MRRHGEIGTAGMGAALAVGLLAALPAVAPAQSAEPLAVRTAGVGARAVALGEAYFAHGGDFYSLHYNPAGLGLATGIRMDGSITHRRTRVDTRYFGTATQADVNSTGLDALGLSYAFPTVRGAMVFGLGATRLRDLDGRYRLSGYNTSDHEWLGETWVEACDLDRGSVYAYTLGLAVESSPGLYLGCSLEAISGRDSYHYQLDAYDTEDVWTPYDGHTWDDGIDYTYRSRGLRLGLGGLWRPLALLQIGAAVRLPAYVKINEDWYQSQTVYLDDGTTDPESEYFDQGIFSYELRLPLEAGVGGVLRLGALGLYGSGTWIDYTQSEYTKAPYDGYDEEYFAENYRPCWMLSGGVEVGTPQGIALRAGYQWAPLLFRPSDLSVILEHEVYSVGLGLPVSRETTLDLAYRLAQWETRSTEVGERWRSGQFLISFGYRF
jgi:hypothetical protein